MRSRVLSFGSLASTLARNQAQAVIDRIQDRLPRLTCQLNLLPSPVDDEAKAGEPFLATCRAEVEHLEAAIIREQIRLTVIEAADMVLPLPPELAVVCVPDRATPYDAFLNRRGRIMDEMEPGGRVGVLSLRSRTQLQAQWPDLNFVLLRGGVERAMETHMRREEIDGLVMPAAITEQLGIQGVVAEIFSPEFILPGPGQGTQVIVGQTHDHEARELLAEIHSTATAAELAAEHAFYRRMVSDQDLPVGALARVTDQEICIVGATGPGTNRISVTGKLDQAEAAGDGLATQLLSAVDTFADLLEADFPDGLPEDDGDEADEAEDFEEMKRFADETDDDEDEQERLRSLENLAGIRPAGKDGKKSDDEDDDDEPYDS